MSSVDLKFRGKSAVRSAYLTVTGSTYGKGNKFSAAALTRHVAMRKYTPEAVFQAINRLEKEGVIEHVGQLKGQPGRGNKKYRVLVERDPQIALYAHSGPRNKTAEPEAVLPAPTVSASLEERLASLEAQVADLLAALRAV